MGLQPTFALSYLAARWVASVPFYRGRDMSRPYSGLYRQRFPRPTPRALALEPAVHASGAGGTTLARVPAPSEKPGVIRARVVRYCL